MVIRTFLCHVLVAVVCVVCMLGVAAKRVKQKQQRRSERPNIIFLMTDDQDTELGSMNFMPKTLRILRGGGAHFENAFVTTPMCCPSRSSMLTGMYVHNHNVYTNNDNCSSVYWRQNFESRSWATYLSNSGYRTGYFGKYLNEYKGDYIPPGWSEWAGLIRNSRFYNYTINFNGKKIKHGDNYYKDYLTDLIANDSVTFLKQSKQIFPNRPVALVLSMPAPHGPEDSAPQYQHLFKNVTTHRTPSYNYAPNPDKQWILQYTGQMEPIHHQFTSLLHQKRLQTLQSVDDAVEKIYTEIKHLGELDNTYFIYTSDHGYHLGQYGLAKGKAMPYEFDIRVPFYMRGPNIPRGIIVPNIALNVDIAPTMLDIAGITIPEHMDGRSIMKLFDNIEEPNSVIDGSLRKKKAWRDSFLVERGKITHKKLVNRERLEAMQNNLIVTKEKRLEDECLKGEYQSPCSVNQQWRCQRDEKGRLRMVKCRSNSDPIPFGRPECVCPTPERPQNTDPPIYRSPTRIPNFTSSDPPLSERDLRRARRRLARRHTLNVHHRQKRFADPKYIGPPSYFKRRNYNPREKRWKTDDSLQNDASLPPVAPGSTCRVLPNNTVVCDVRDPNAISKESLWRLQKKELDDIIHNYKHQLDRLKNLRRRLKTQRINDFSQSDNLPDVTPRQDGIEHQTGVGFGENDFVQDTSTATDGDGDMDYNYSDTISRENLSTEKELSDEERALLSHEDVYNSMEEGEDECHCDTQQDQSYPVKERDLIRNERAKRKQQKFIDRQRKRQERQEDRGQRKSLKKKNKKLDVSKDCGNNNMKCFTHDNDHWKTPPLWNLGPFCFCPNSNNNTYWCVRTINDTHNYLYCEFITGFISYYDLLQDPYQLTNAVYDLDYGRLQQLQDLLDRLKSCRGSRECTIRSRPPPDGVLDNLEESSGSSGDLELGSGDLNDGGIYSLYSSGWLDQPESSVQNAGDSAVLAEVNVSSGDCDDEEEEVRLKDEHLWLTYVLRLDGQ